MLFKVLVFPQGILHCACTQSYNTTFNGRLNPTRLVLVSTVCFGHIKRSFHFNTCPSFACPTWSSDISGDWLNGSSFQRIFQLNGWNFTPPVGHNGVSRSSSWHLSDECNDFTQSSPYTPLFYLLRPSLSLANKLVVPVTVTFCVMVLMVFNHFSVWSLCRRNTWYIRKTQWSSLKAPTKELTTFISRNNVHVFAQLWFIADVCHKYPATCALCIRQIWKIFITLFKFYFKAVVIVRNDGFDVQEKLRRFDWQAEIETPPWLQLCSIYKCINKCFMKLCV